MFVVGSRLKKIEYAPICDIDFTTPQKKRKMLENHTSCPLIATSSSSPSTMYMSSNQIDRPTEEEMETLFKNLSECETKPALVSLVPGYCDLYIPKSECDCLPKPLGRLFKEELLQATYPELLKVSEETFLSISITSEQAKSLEVLTIGQSQFRFRDHANAENHLCFNVSWYVNSPWHKFNLQAPHPHTPSRNCTLR